MTSDPQTRESAARQDEGDPPRFPLTPWLVVLGVVAVLVGLACGVIMAFVGARAG